MIWISAAFYRVFLTKCVILLNRTHFGQIIICLTWMKSFLFLCWSRKPTTNSIEWNFVNSFLEVNLHAWQLTPESIISTIKLRNSQFRVAFDIHRYLQFISNNKSYFLIYLLPRFDFQWESSESSKCVNYVIRTITVKYYPTLSNSFASESTVAKYFFLDFNTLALVLNRESDQDSR